MISSSTGLHLYTELRCSIELAPINYLEKFKLKDFEARYNHIMEPINPALLTRKAAKVAIK
jgi:hypothetical protein